MQPKLSLLPQSEFKILRIVRIIGPEWNRFRGYLPYLRNYDPQNDDSNNEDILDKQILQTLLNDFPQSTCTITPILFDGQLKDILSNIQGGTSKEITLQFSPLLNIQTVLQSGKTEFNAYAKRFRLRLLLPTDSEKINMIHDFYICHLPYSELESIVKTIHPV